MHGSFEVRVVEGRSAGDTCALVNALIPVFPHPLRVVRAARNRALPLNQAAELARGRVLLFLNADTLLPLDALESLEGPLQDHSIVGGNFDRGREVLYRSFDIHLALVKIHGPAPPDR